MLFLNYTNLEPSYEVIKPANNSTTKTIFETCDYNYKTSINKLHGSKR